jgi:sugar phosphate permease
MRRWAMLSLGMAAQAAASIFLFGLPFLLPVLHAETGLPLGRLGLLVGAPSAGMLFGLVAWGAVADRYGERAVLAIGLSGAGVLLVVAAFWRRPVPLGILLALAGLFASSVNPGSGRLVLGWFPAHRRGVAMSWRQSALPLGLAVAGVLLPGVALHGGVRGAFLTEAGICLLTASAIVFWAVDPPRPEPVTGERTGHPYRQPALWRVHGASGLLTVSQAVISVFALLYLVGQRHVDVPAAGRVVAVASLASAGARLLAGAWSDLLASRLRPMRWLAFAGAATVGLLALAAALHLAAGTTLVVLAAIVTASGNGLAFTSVAELAGPAWAGRALGVQVTVQNLVGALIPALWGGLIAARGFAVGFALAAAFPLAAAFVTPRDPAAPAAPAPPPEAPEVTVPAT